MASTVVLILATAYCYSLSPPVGYPILLVAMLIAVRYSQLEVSIAVLCVVAIALCEAMYRDWLPFSGDAPTLLRVMDFLVVLAAGSLLLGSLVAESRLKDRLLLRANQDRLWQSETKFEDAFRASAQGMAVTGLDGRWLRVNAALCQIVGYSEAELLGMDFQSITHPDDLGHDQEMMRAMLAGEGGRQFEKRYIHKSGKVIIVQLSVSLVRDAAGAPLNYVVQVMDITDRKRAEELWRFGLDNAGDVMWDWNILAGTLAFSGKIRELLGCLDDEVPKTAEAWRALIHPDDAARAREATAALLELPPRPYARQYRVRCTDGSYKWIYSRGLVMSRDRDDRPLRAVGTIVDITEVRNLQEKLHQTDKMAALGQLTGGVAHDVNNDLGIIVGSAELICEQAVAGSREAVLSTRIIATVQRCRDLVRRMLAFSRQADIAPEPLELAGFLKGFIETLGRTLGSHIGVRLHAAPAAVHWVSLDRGMLESCLINLSINARDAMPNGGVLTMSLDAQPGAVLLTVTDTGTGMSEAVRQRLFEPFFTTKPAGSGVGLGLAMVYGFVQQSGGGIEVESKLGIGTRFVLRFPAAAPPEEKAPNPGQPATAAGAARTILLVDDNDALRVTLREQLAALKCTTHEAATFEQAVCVLRSVADIDFIISDFDLGDGPDGVQLARWADQNGHGGPGALISGHPRHFAGLPQNWHVLQKPIQLGDLKKLLSPGAAAAANGQEAQPGLSGSPLHPAGAFVPAILVVEDNDDMRFIAVQILKRGGYTLLEAADAGE
ncbi:MAG TPA: PAS domain S-box protein, partial [Rhizomicrobium sp.]|nr:PAS domain S-box protein [Rhizomicrobium sp.]